MASLLRILLSLVGLLLLVLVIAAIAIPLYFDPNDFKEEMAAEVKKKTGRELVIDGEIQLSLFPWLGVELAGVSLGNAPGFTAKTFASVKDMEVRVKLMPLLKKQVEMDTVSLTGLHLNLEKDPNGRGNWEDLGGEPKDKGQAEADKQVDAGGEGPPPIAALAIGGLDIQNARVDWNDRQTGQQYTLEGFNLETGAIQGGEPVDLDGGFHLAMTEPAMQGDFELQGRLNLDPAAQTYRMEGLGFKAQMVGDGLPSGRMGVDLAADLDVDLARDTLSLGRLQLTVLGITLNGELAVQQLSGDLSYNGTLSLAAFSPRDLIERLGQPPLQTADEQVLQSLSLDTRVSGSKSKMSLKPVELRLDDTTLSGEIGLPNFEGPALRFDLAVDAIDVDRYLPPPAEGEEATPASPGAAATASSELPLEPIRALDVIGRFKVGTMKVAKLNVQDIVLNLRAQDGVVRLNPIDANLYQGRYSGNISLDARGRQPRIAVNEKLSGVQAGPLLKDLTGEDRVTGQADVSAKLKMEGAGAEAIKKTANGEARFSFTNGAVKGINIGQIIREAQARIKGQSVSDSAEEAQTDFTELSGSVRIADGVVRNQDLAAKSPLLRVEGKGQADIVKETVDYRVTTTIVGTSTGQGGKELEKLNGIPLPIHLSGKLTDPSYKLDLESILKQKATQEVKAKAKEKVEKKLQEKLGDKAKGLLKGLF